MKNKLTRLSLNLLTIFILIGFIPPSLIFAQEETPPIDEADNDQEYATYIIESGDTLASIAFQFGISLEELITANEIENPNAISVGTELILPGIIGVAGVLTNVTTSFGQTLDSLSKQYQISSENLMQMNKLISPIELYDGATLIIPIQEDLPAVAPLSNFQSDVTVLEEAVLSGQNQWEIARTNQKIHLWHYVPGELLVRTTDMEETTNSIASVVSSVVITPEDFYQGSLATITINTTEPLVISGSLGEWTLNFFEENENQYVAYAGIHARTEPGLLPFSITGANENTNIFTFEQMLVTSDSYFGSESLIVDQITLDPEENEKEDELIFSLITPATSTKYWDAPFSCVVDQPICIRSWYGTNRNYNDGYFYNFHSGLDFGVCASLNIYAPADGVVVFTGPLTVRGNATVVDHGRGVYSAFYHQSEILVEEGQTVSRGQIIGLIGTTGRSTGAHLHYDFFVNGVQVNPLNILDPNCQ